MPISDCIPTPGGPASASGGRIPLAAAILLLPALMALPTAVARPLRAQAGAPETGVIEGRVTSAETTVPIPGAVVTSRSGAGEVRQAVANERGVYRLGRLAPGSQTVRVRALGYTPVTVTIDVRPGEVVARTFPLTPSPAVLDQVIVTGTATPTERRALPNAATVVTAEDIERKGIQRVQDLFRGDVPGVFSPEMGTGVTTEGQLRLFSRGAANLGGFASPPKIFVDGVLLSDTEYLHSLDPRSIERIEVLPGPQASTIYGSQAISGVVQIFLKRGDLRLRRPQVTATLSGGTVENNFDERMAPHQDHAVDVRGATGGASYNLGASYRSAGEWLPGRTEDRRGVSGGIRIGLGKITTDVSARYGVLSFDGFSRPFYVEAYRSGRFDYTQAVPGFIYEQEGTSTRVAQQTLGATVAYDPTSWWQHRVTAGRDGSTRVNQRGPEYGSLSDTTWVNGTSEYAATTLSYVTTLAPALRLAVRPTLTAGFDLTNYELSLGEGRGRVAEGPFTSLGYNRVESATRGYFIQPQVGLWDAVYLTYGLRAENNDNYGPEYGVNYAPRYGVSVVRSVGGLTAKVRAASGRATQPPAADTREDEFETSTRYGITYRSRVGNRRIRPEFQRGTEVGVDLEYGAVGSLQITRYDQTADDLIADLQLPPDTVVVEGFDEPLITSSSTAINVGRVRTQGWEVQARAQTGPVVLTGTFSTTDGRVIRVNEEAFGLYRVGDRIRGPARRSGALDASYSAGRLAAGVRLSYIGPVFLNRSIALTRQIQFARLPRLVPRLFNVLDPQFSGYEQGGYRTVDVHAAYDVTQAANLFARVYNAGNYFRNDYDDFQAAPGRRLLAGVRLRY